MQIMTKRESDCSIARQAMIYRQTAERRALEQRHADERLALQSRHHDEQSALMREYGDVAYTEFTRPFSSVWA